jgi:hypothetical protein
VGVVGNYGSRRGVIGGESERNIRKKGEKVVLESIGSKNEGEMFEIMM